MPAKALTLHPQTLCFYIHRPCAFTSTDLGTFFYYHLSRLFTFLQSVKCNPSELSGGGGAAVAS